MKVWFTKLSSAICFMTLCLSHFSEAQNSPQDFVKAHNVIRAAVGVGPLVWNRTVASYAQKYADKRMKDCEMEHSYGPYGENLAEGYGNLDGVDAVKMWASEKPDYDHSSNSCVSGGDDCLHYTQIVWSKSVHLGCGRAKCANGWVFVICSYDPVGNVEGERPY
ncbi:hypothetical protein E1A91_D01G212600v1 [Gossypium mustelinum]|uniref:Pathogenesis-related protein 1 n=1 Tax=Gossypium mustelinum TaxID=34275 RepID=A0A5D2W9G4_GOSMU|nr:hypothetical protein E1A91_D01G212600v1 [Gossypium mustelinum]